MGLNNIYINFFNYNIEKYGLTGSKMLELGDQLFEDGTTGKTYYSLLKYNHTSIDLNGKHGSLIKDLRYPNEFVELYNSYDIITNAGTTEHVVPVENQFDCFSIIHDCLKLNGLQLHVVPSIEGFKLGYWTKHCVVYYSMDFFKMLAKENNYEIVEMKLSSNNLLLVCIRKINNNKFMINKQLFLDHLHIVPENIHSDIHPSTKIKK